MTGAEQEERVHAKLNERRQKRLDGKNGDFLDHIIYVTKTFFAMVGDRRYQFPTRIKLAGLIAVLYTILPIDILPEVLLGPLGILDDIGVVMIALRMLYDEIIRYGKISNR